MLPKTKNRSVLIIADEPNSSDINGGLGYGDLIRVLAIAPNFEASQITWQSPQSLTPLVKDCEILDKIESNIRKPVDLRKFDFVLNLCWDPLESNAQILNICDLIDISSNLKEQL